MRAGSLAAAWCPAQLARLCLARRTRTVAPSPSAGQEERRLAGVPPGLTSHPGPRPRRTATHPPAITGDHSSAASDKRPQTNRRAACLPVGRKRGQGHREARGGLEVPGHQTSFPSTPDGMSLDWRQKCRRPVAGPSGTERRVRRHDGTERTSQSHQRRAGKPSARRCANCHDFSPSSTPARSTN